MINRLLILALSFIIQFDCYSQALNDTLISQLEIIHEDDQSLRRQIGIVQENYGTDSPQWEELVAKIDAADSVNLVKVVRMIDKYGYPGKSLVGEAQQSTAFLVIQHSDLAVQEKYLPMLRAAAEAGELPYSSLALLIDRILMRNELPQKYGTQLFRDDETGEIQFYEIANEECVDIRRKEVGLPPLKEYAKWFDLKYKRPGKCKKKKKSTETSSS